MPLPIQEAIRDLSADLLGRPTAVDKADAPIPPGEMAAVAAFRDNDGVVKAVLVVDRAAVAVFGGSLVMVPEVVIHEVLTGTEVPDNLYENYWEVANIMASLLNREGASHVRLADRLTSWDDTPEDVKAVVTTPVRQRWFTATVVGYGEGRLGFVAST